MLRIEIECVDTTGVNMKLLKATAIAFFLAMAAALVVLSAGAQQPTPLPHVKMAIPVAPPRGWDPKVWANLRAHCQSIADKAAAHIPYASWQEMQDGSMCMDLGPLPESARHEPAQPQAT